MSVPQSKRWGLWPTRPAPAGRCESLVAFAVLALLCLPRCLAQIVSEPARGRRLQLDEDLGELDTAALVATLRSTGDAIEGHHLDQSASEILEDTSHSFTIQGDTPSNVE